MQKTLFIVAISLLLLAGCAKAGLSGGSVDKNVRDFNALQASGKTKRVDYYCSFDKIAAATGEYCIGGDNQDYVSYFTKFDNASVRNQLINTVSMINSEPVSGQLRYYQIYAPQGSFEKLKQYDIEDTPPTSFAIKDGESFRLVISKSDLLMRAKIYPGLNIMAVEDAQTMNINDYTAVYRLVPYVFKVKYADAEIARILGLPDYTELAGKLDSIKKIQLNNYISMLNEFWQAPDAQKYSADKLTGMDYAMPQLALPKLGSAESSINLKISPPFPSEGLLNSYLPSYDLEKIMLIYSDASGNELIAHTFERNDIIRTLISYDNEALVYTDAIPEGDITLRFVHKATAPAATGLNSSAAETLGLGWIYSDIAATAETNLHIERFYQLEELPRNCVDKDKFIISFIDKGHTKAEAENIYERLNPVKSAKCTPAQRSIGELLALSGII